MSDEEYSSEEEVSEEEEEEVPEAKEEEQEEKKENIFTQRQEKKNTELDEQLKEYIAEWRKQRAKEEEELNKLKEKQAKRKVLRAEEEKRLAEAKKAEDERRYREEQEKKQREQEEKKRRLEEAEKKRQALAQAQKAAAGGKANFKVGKKDDKLSNIQAAKNEISKTKEQLAEEKKIALSIRIQPLKVDGLGLEALKKKAEDMWNQIVKLETEKYDLEERQKRQDYDPKIRVASKFERTIDHRSYGDKMNLFNGGWTVLFSEQNDKLWEEKADEWGKRPKTRLPKWFGERPGKKTDDPETPEEEEKEEEMAPPADEPEEIVYGSGTVFDANLFQQTFDVLGARFCLPADFDNSTISQLASACEARATAPVQPPECAGASSLGSFYNCLTRERGILNADATVLDTARVVAGINRYSRDPAWTAKTTRIVHECLEYASDGLTTRQLTVYTYLCLKWSLPNTLRGVLEHITGRTLQECGKGLYAGYEPHQLYQAEIARLVCLFQKFIGADGTIDLQAVKLAITYGEGAKFREAVEGCIRTQTKAGPGGYNRLTAEEFVQCWADRGVISCVHQEANQVGAQHPDNCDVTLSF
ncbi:Troponin T [Amphibalanus amphitrite]|uniref:Troponin T n=1 Tax=Amphibalanus amphitrite TaxID=1232801 RepID=A0A6A4W2H9_AMPAM|nr:Troponin T [Amphibalanus amphitrite]KAF0300123.1 Troponin T [Amphibalanus amphitrite]